MATKRITYPSKPPILPKTKQKPIGVLYPFDNERGGVFRSSYLTEDQVFSNLKNLLLTKRGERYGNPDFGTNLYNKLFEQVTDESLWITEIKADITNAIALFMPYVTIETFSVEFHPRIGDENTEYAIRIQLSVSVNGTGIYKEVIMFIQNDGQISIQ